MLDAFITRALNTCDQSKLIYFEKQWLDFPLHKPSMQNPNSGVDPKINTKTNTYSILFKYLKELTIMAQHQGLFVQHRFCSLI